MPPPTEPLGDLRTIAVLGERVAVVETKVGSLKEDTGVIRATIHGINNEIQKIVSTELRCAQALEGMHELMRERSVQVNRIEATVDSLSQAKSMAEGAWAATVRISAAILACASILGMAGGGIAWALGHVALR